MCKEPRNHGSATKRRRTIFGTVLLATAVCWLSPSGRSFQDRANDKVDEARRALEKWVENRRLIAHEKRKWKLGRELLTERIALVKREITSLRERIGEAEKSISDADKKRVQLIAENEKLKEVSSGLAKTVVELERRVKAVLGRLPNPIREQVRRLSQRLPKDSEKTELPLADRYQNVIGILNEVDKFNRQITVTNEVHTLDDGTTAEVTALYVGIGHGYYVTAKEDAAGVGTASDEGWAWKPANEAAAKIARAIAILNNEQAPAFVPLPIRIK
jgi:hypothetical protein